MPNFLRAPKNHKNAPGILVECKSGRFLAFYDHRTDIIANGNNEVEAKKNLKKLYALVMKHEADEEKSEEEKEKNKQADIPKTYKTKPFVEHELTD